MNIVLVEPDIPNNTGNIGRLCVNTQSALHLVKPLGFSLDEKAVRRAGLDYWPRLDLHVHESFDDFLQTVEAGNLYFLSTKVDKPYTHVDYHQNDYLIFGSETKGLAESILSKYAEQSVTIPMMDTESRSMNLAHAVSVVLYEGLRQIHNNF